MMRPSPFVLRVFPRVVIAVVALVALVPALASVTGNDDLAHTLGGDFPSFYAAGQIVLDGRIDELYDPDVQFSYQETFQEKDAGLLYFAYPPVTALAYAPLAALPYGVAATVHSLIALGALVGAMWLLLPQVDLALSRRDHVALGTALALVAMPIVTAVLGGQNTTVTLVLIAAVWYLNAIGSPVWAGLAAGAVFFKPQFGVVVLVALVVARRWRSAVAAMVVAIGMFLVGVATSGAGWLGDWLDQVRKFGDLNAEANGELFVNVTGFVQHVLGDGAAATLVGTSVWVFVAAVTAVILWRDRLSWSTIGVVGAAVILLAPSALYYDSGVGIVTGLVAGLGAPGIVGIVAGTLAATWLQALENTFGWSPLFLVLLAVWAWQTVRSIRAGGVSQAPGTLAAPAGQEQRSSGWRAIRSS